MKILCILTAYNEIEYLPYKKKFCDYHDLDLYVIDNYSDDGTWEWLQDNNIASHRFDTNGMFALGLLQKEIVRTLLSLKRKPDWVIYNGADMFPIILPNLKDKILEIDDKGFNLAAMPWIGIFNTGEDRSKDPFNTFFYCNRNPGGEGWMLHKYHDSVSYYADNAQFSNIPNKKIKINGLMINYGDTKTFENREIIYSRRKKAWESGVTHVAHGNHYREGHDNNWIWNKNELQDIRLTDNFKYIRHLQKVCGKN